MEIANETARCIADNLRHHMCAPARSGARADTIADNRATIAVTHARANGSDISVRYANCIGPRWRAADTRGPAPADEPSTRVPRAQRPPDLGRAGLHAVLHHPHRDARVSADRDLHRPRRRTLIRSIGRVRPPLRRPEVCVRSGCGCDGRVRGFHRDHSPRRVRTTHGSAGAIRFDASRHRCRRVGRDGARVGMEHNPRSVRPGVVHGRGSYAAAELTAPGILPPTRRPRSAPRRRR